MPYPENYVAPSPALLGVLPRPQKTELEEGEFCFGEVTTICEGLTGSAVDEGLRRFGAKIKVVDDDDPTAQIRAVESAAVPIDGFRIQVTPTTITVEYSNWIGCRYAVGALEQLLYLAFRFGADQARMGCGRIEDAPHFYYRGFMLDSARHFQSADTILRLLQTMVRLRLNYFHWHLTDSEGWRLPSAGAPDLNTLGTIQKGSYTREEIDAIRKYAFENAIEIVPEIDFPGHSRGVLGLHPELRCIPDQFGNEVCLGNPETLKFVFARIDEAMALFPGSQYFHIGGDEAWDGWWRQCPKCQAKAKELGLTGEDFPRKLEAWFMREISQYLLDHGRTPISWRTNAILTPQNVLQCWGNAGDMYSCAYHDQGKNLVISSIDNAFYLDYPQCDEEPRFQWMATLSEEGVHAANPAAHMGPVLGDRLIGLECPLWTELVPEWRLEAKLFPRLIAAADVAWNGKNTDYADYRSRRKALQLAGYKVW